MISKLVGFRRFQYKRKSDGQIVDACNLYITYPGTSDVVGDVAETVFCRAPGRAAAGGAGVCAAGRSFACAGSPPRRNLSIPRRICHAAYQPVLAAGSRALRPHLLAGCRCPPAGCAASGTLGSRQQHDHQRFICRTLRCRRASCTAANRTGSFAKRAARRGYPVYHPFGGRVPFGGRKHSGFCMVRCGGRQLVCDCPRYAGLCRRWLRALWRQLSPAHCGLL